MKYRCWACSTYNATIILECGSTSDPEHCHDQRICFAKNCLQKTTRCLPEIKHNLFLKATVKKGSPSGILRGRSLSTPFLQVLPAACAALQMKQTQLTDDVPQQRQSGLDLHLFDSVLMMSQSGSQYSSGRLYVQDICMRHPVSTSHLGHCSPQTATDYFMEAFRGKTRPAHKTEP